jgi:hypothetical protein
MGMDQYLLIPFLVGWTSIYQLFWCSPVVQGFDTMSYLVIKNKTRFQQKKKKFDPNPWIVAGPELVEANICRNPSCLGLKHCRFPNCFSQQESHWQAYPHCPRIIPAISVKKSGLSRPSLAGIEFSHQYPCELRIIFPMDHISIESLAIKNEGIWKWSIVWVL